jgi:hypothetical protein
MRASIHVSGALAEEALPTELRSELLQAFRRLGR